MGILANLSAKKMKKKNWNGKSFCSGEEDIVDEKKDKEIN
jgi:hypothetical protein